MIVIRLEGGLANRMFQYAFFIAISKQRDDVFLDEDSFIPKLKHENISIKDVFPTLHFPEYRNDRFKVYYKKSLFSKVLRNLLEAFSNKYYHEKEMTYYENLISTLPKTCYLRGYWQTEKYFKDIETEIRDLFCFTPLADHRNLSIVEKMQNSNSVAIHVRKGKDYMSDSSRTDGICDVSYYNKAINIIQDKVKDPRFFIFTDNQDWVIDNITGIDYVLVNWNPVFGNGNYIDMQLMSSAKHNIIANSSYSWWAAWLNNTVSKIVVAPDFWFVQNSKIKNPTDLIPVEWIVV